MERRAYKRPRAMLLVDNLLNWIRSEAVVGAKVAADELGWQLMCFDWYRAEGREREILTELLREPPDALLLVSPYETRSLDLCNAAAQSIPTVQVVERHPEIMCNSVLTDNVDGASLATRYLIGLGHRAVGHITIAVDRPSAAERARGYRDEMAQHKLVPHDDWILRLPGDTQVRDLTVRSRLIQNYLTSPSPPTAVFVYSDIVAREVLEVTDRLCIRVPEDLAVVGYGNMPHALAGVALTTVSNEFRSNGYIAMKRLHGRVTGLETGPPTVVTVKPRLVIRESTRGPGAGHERWDEVAQFVHKHFRSSLSLHDIARIASLEPHYCSRRFREVFGEPFTQYVNTLRLEATCLLLATTDWAIKRIADECGFRNLNYFHRLFKREYLTTPGQFRREHKFVQ